MSKEDERGGGGGGGGCVGVRGVERDHVKEDEDVEEKDAGDDRGGT